MIPGFKIEFNAVFVVNIVMSMGLAVEFCVHVMIAFLRVKGTNHDRARIVLYLYRKYYLVSEPHG